MLSYIFCRWIKSERCALRWCWQRCAQSDLIFRSLRTHPLWFRQRRRDSSHAANNLAFAGQPADGPVEKWRPAFYVFRQLCDRQLPFGIERVPNGACGQAVFCIAFPFFFIGSSR